nr:citrate synthase [Burkholderiaceae bacterium]
MSHPGKGGEYLSAAEAIRLLGVKAQTLYAYASRHLIRTIPHGNKRLKLYSREDVEHLRERGHARSGKRFTASGGLRWGEPIVHTAITEITDAGPKYRNRLATDLARSNCSFESVAELLWSGISVDEHICWNRPPPALDPDRLINALGALRSDVQLIHAFLILALTTGIAPHNRDEIRQGTTTLVARDLISSLPGCFGYIAKRRSYHTCRPSTGVAESLARALGMSEDEEVVSALNAALILVADHEMTPPTFSARVAASSGSDLCSCIVSAICTHSGTRVRRACD